jgi:hypothetical protein
VVSPQAARASRLTTIASLNPTRFIADLHTKWIWVLLQ